MEIQEYVLDFIRAHQFQYSFRELKHNIPHYNGNVSTHEALCELFHSDVLGVDDNGKVFVDEGQ